MKMEAILFFRCSQCLKAFYATCFDVIDKDEDSADILLYVKKGFFPEVIEATDFKEQVEFGCDCGFPVVPKRIPQTALAERDQLLRDVSDELKKYADHPDIYPEKRRLCDRIEKLIGE